MTRCLPLILLFLAFSSINFSQQLPDRIGDYKVHKTPIVIDGKDQRRGIKIQSVSIGGVDISGITLETEVSLAEVGKSGKIDYITFENFSVGNLGFEIADFRKPFHIVSKGAVSLPGPLVVYVENLAALNAFRSQREKSSTVLPLKGRAYVFGRFKRFGFSFKRAVPVIIDVEINNPLQNLTNDLK